MEVWGPGGRKFDVSSVWGRAFGGLGARDPKVRGAGVSGALGPRVCGVGCSGCWRFEVWGSDF